MFNISGCFRGGWVVNTICATLIIYNVQQYQYFKCLTMSMFQHSNAMISTAQYQKCHSNFYGTGVWEKILPRKKTAFLNFQNCHFFTLTGHFWLERHVFISAFDDSDSINKATCFHKNHGHHTHPQIEIFINVIKQLRKSLLF